MLTTNRVFKEWNGIFEGSAVLSTLNARICHRVEIVRIEAAAGAAASPRT